MTDLQRLSVLTPLQRFLHRVTTVCPSFQAGPPGDASNRKRKRGGSAPVPPCATDMPVLHQEGAASMTPIMFTVMQASGAEAFLHCCKSLQANPQRELQCDDWIELKQDVAWVEGSHRYWRTGTLRGTTPRWMRCYLWPAVRDLPDLAETLMNAAAACDTASYMRFLRRNGCPWNDRTVVAAICHDSLECVQYAIRNDCPCDLEGCIAVAQTRGAMRCLRFLFALCHM
eukprot:gene11853-13375_t